MDFNYIESFEGGIVIKNVRNFELPHIFDCGQCFRWDRKENGNYIGVAFRRVIEVEKRDNDVLLYNTSPQILKRYGQIILICTGTMMK